MPALTLTNKPLLILDGGLGTTLEDLHDQTFSARTPLWSSDLLAHDPPTLRRAQAAFARAGADVLLTATYQASLDGFARTSRRDGREGGYGPQEAREYMRTAVPIARGALRSAEEDGEKRRGDGFVALSLGAYGATMSPSTEYSGVYDEEHGSREALAQWHAERLLVFAEDEGAWEGIDWVAFETLPRVDEVRAAREAVQKVMIEGKRERKPFWISCVFPNEGLRLPDGSAVGNVVRALFEGNLPVPNAVGVNCTKLPHLIPIMKSLQTAIRMQYPNTAPMLVLYPDGARDLVYNTEIGEWESNIESGRKNRVSWDEELFRIVQALAEEKDSIWSGFIVGGCCKSTPEMIRTLRKWFEGGCG